jgi:hypothetical protein
VRGESGIIYINLSYGELLVTIIRKIGLTGVGGDIKLLVNMLPPNYSIEEDEYGKNYLTYKAEEHGDPGNDLKNITDKIDQLCNLAEILFRKKVSIAADNSIIEISEDCKSKGFTALPLTATITVNAYPPDVLLNGKKKEPDYGKASRLLELAQQDDDIRRALKYWVDENNWNGLNKIFEIIRSDVGGGVEFYNRFNSIWGSKKTISRFTHTANYMHRHDKKIVQKPINPMDFNQAKEYIRQTLCNWLLSKS